MDIYEGGTFENLFGDDNKPYIYIYRYKNEFDVGFNCEDLDELTDVVNGLTVEQIDRAIGILNYIRGEISVKENL